MYWGIEDFDRNHTSSWDITDPGSPILDPLFEFNSDTQPALLEFCNSLLNLPFISMVDCWIYDL